MTPFALAYNLRPTLERQGFATVAAVNLQPTGRPLCANIDEDVNDADRSSFDPATRHVVGRRATLPEKQSASTSEVGRFETETLSTKSNLTALMDLSGEWIDKVHLRKPQQRTILDMDSSVSETYGQQQGTAYNGHFTCMC